MSDDYETRVVIIGAGAAGTYIADALSALRCDVTVLDQSPVSAYSSTRNQGWLQSGALYAGFDDIEAVESCKAGSQAILSDCPESVREDVHCYFLYTQTTQRDELIAKCRAADVRADAVTDAAFRHVITENPCLMGSPFVCAAEVSDRPFDTTALLRRVTQRASTQGARFHRVPCLHVVTVAQTGDRWRISTGDGRTVEASIVIAAVGPYLPHILDSAEPSLAQGLSATKIPVMVLRCDTTSLTNAMMVTPRETNAPNLVPFHSAEGQGISVCLAGADELCDQRGALDEDMPPGAEWEFGQQISRYYPGIVRLAAKHDIRGHIYMCQKLKATTRGILLRSAEDRSYGSPRRIVGVYPGKFTAAPVAASRILELVERWIPGDKQRPLESEPPLVARQRYYDEPTFRLEVREGRRGSSVALASLT